jgi:hypothetical protein
MSELPTRSGQAPLRPQGRRPFQHPAKHLDFASGAWPLVLCRAVCVIQAELGSGPGRLLTTARGKFAAPLAKASDEAIEHRFVRALRFVACSLPGHGGLAGEDELRDVGKSDGVTAGDAPASELPDEIAEEEIDLIGGGETVDVSEKLGGEDFGVDGWDTRFETIGVIGAERGAVYAVGKPTVLVD